MRTLWIVAPCFYDTESFLRVHREIVEGLREARIFSDVRFVLIDDSGGQDRAVAAAAALPGVQVVSPPYNAGHQAALVYGLRQLRSAVQEHDFVLTMDSDGEDRPQDVPALLAPLLRQEHDIHLVALAQRTKRRESPAFKAFYLVFKALFRALTGTTIRSGNFAAFRGWMLKELIFHPHFDFAYASTFMSIPLKLAMVPLPRGARYAGKSKLGFMGLFSHGIRMFMPFSERIAARGLLASIACLGLSALSLAGAVLYRPSPAAFLSPWGAFVGACLMAAVVSFHGLGLFGLLYVTFTQTKSRSLRGLQEFRPAASPILVDEPEGVTDPT